jgi:hypothetical protein
MQRACWTVWNTITIVFAGVFEVLRGTGQEPVGLRLIIHIKSWLAQGLGLRVQTSPAT